MSFSLIEEYENFDAQIRDKYYGNKQSKTKSNDATLFDSSVLDLDFSGINGTTFRQSFTQVNNLIKAKPVIAKPVVAKPIEANPIVAKPVVGRDANLFTSSNQLLTQGRTLPNASNPIAQPQITSLPPMTPTISKDGVIEATQQVVKSIKLPQDMPLIVDGVNKFILNNSGSADSIKNLGYYKGEKLKELILIFDNTQSMVDFDVQIFNPSMPLDYLYSTSQSLNSKIVVGGGNVSYSDVLFNLLANPTLIPTCKFAFSGSNVTEQVSQPMFTHNKQISGIERVNPINLNLEIDTDQFSNEIVFFDMFKQLGRPFIPDGMDIIEYKVLAGNSVTMCFFYKQVSLKKVFIEEARTSKALL